MRKFNIASFLKMILIGFLITVSSCQDFLEETNPNEISTGSFWRSANDLQFGVNAIYNAFKNQNVLLLVNEYQRTDMAWPGFPRPNTINPFFLQTFNAATPEMSRKWNALYQGIFRANQVIEAYERLAPSFTDATTQENTRQMLAQARFFRGLFHFYLHSSFNNGEIIIRDKLPVTLEELNKGTSTSSEVIEFFREDLEFAVENLPAVWPGRDLGRVTAGAAEAVLGKSYLYEGNYEVAAQYFRNVIDNYNYRLTEDIGDNFSPRTELNQESILEINYTADLKVNEEPSSAESLNNSLNRSFAAGSQNIGGWRTLYPANWLIMEYKRDTPDPVDRDNEVLARDNSNNVLKKTNGEDSVHIRKYSIRTSKSIALVDDQDEPYYQTFPAMATPFNNGETAFWRKHTNSEILSSEFDNDPINRSGVNVRVIRLADVYLMLAECLIDGGNNGGGVNEALTYINRVRRRAKVVLLGSSANSEFPNFTHDNLNYSASELMEHLMHVERPLELSAEGHAIRHLDLRRWGITQQRFQDVGEMLFGAENFIFQHPENGNTVTRWGAVLKEVETPEEVHPRYVRDRVVQSVNYVESQHAYWPIPETERANNSSL